MVVKNSADSNPKDRILADTLDSSDEALAGLLGRLKASADPDEIRALSQQIEQVVFHKQLENA